MRRAFLLVVLAQAAHSIEEYATRLYEVFAPARAVSLFLADDARVGFVVANTGFFVVGLLCWLGPVRRGVRAVAWFWAVLELLNGTGHLLLAWNAGGYFPGAGTAPLLLLSAGWLVSRLRDDR